MSKNMPAGPYKNVLQALRAEAKKYASSVEYVSRNYLINNSYLYKKDECTIFEKMPPISEGGVMMTGYIGGEFSDVYFYTEKLFAWTKQEGFRTLNCKANNLDRIAGQEEDDELQTGSVKFHRERIEVLKSSFKKSEITHVGIVLRCLGHTAEARTAFVRILRIEDIALFTANNKNKKRKR